MISIFMDSMVATGCPAVTESPTATNSLVSFPVTGVAMVIAELDESVIIENVSLMSGPIGFLVRWLIILIFKSSMGVAGFLIA